MDRGNEYGVAGGVAVRIGGATPIELLLRTAEDRMPGESVFRIDSLKWRNNSSRGGLEGRRAEPARLMKCSVSRKSESTKQEKPSEEKNDR